MAKSRAYEETLKELLVDPREAAEYLNAALEEGDPAAFLPALKDVANVHGDVGQARRAGQPEPRKHVRMLSEDGNPRIRSLNAVLHAQGLKLSIAPEKPRRSAA